MSSSYFSQPGGQRTGPMFSINLSGTNNSRNATLLILTGDSLA
jgi:hypothetical protein